MQASILARLISAALVAGAATAAVAAEAPAPQAEQAPSAGDAAVTSQAQAALQQDKDLATLPLTVSSNAGVLVVKGAAPSAELAQKAVTVLAAVPGVKEVRSEIKVG
jgi:osmotically-inducible protein OsmY